MLDERRESTRRISVDKKQLTKRSVWYKMVMETMNPYLGSALGNWGEQPSADASRNFEVSQWEPHNGV
jgi:hypothetical protein